MDLSSHGFAPESLSALAEASAAINSTLDLVEVLDRIAGSAASVMRAEASSVLIYNPLLNKLVFAAAVGPQGSVLAGKEFDAELGIAGRMLKTRKPENVSDVTKNPDFFSGIDELSTFQTRGLMGAPMIYQDQVVGVVEVLNPIGADAFQDSDLELMRVFANLAASAVHNARVHENLRKENRALRDSVLAETEIIGSSKAIREVLKLADRVAPTNAGVLLLGETGTGKELLAKYIHKVSDRSDRTFVAVNCAALTETLLESELFGHEKGAFTGAISQHLGRFELADNGTLFLDEIGDISPSTQVKLLRLLQEHAFTRVGGTKTISCDVRIIAATNRDLKKAIKDGKFRDDLYYRLNVFPIKLPPLRERREDILELAMHFAHTASRSLGQSPKSFTDEAQTLLVAHDWRGNIRELSNVIERAVLMADGSAMGVDHLPPEIAGASEGVLENARTGARAGAKPGGLRDTERAMIVRALRDCGWNQSAAARDLGISRDNLRYRIKKYEIKKGE